MTDREIIKSITGMSGTMLDLGCGTGIRTKLFKNFKITAVDKDRESLDQLFIRLKDKGYDFKTVRSDIREYDIIEDYDIIMCTFVLHFMPRNESSGVLEKIKSHTKPGGLNVLSWFTVNGELKSTNFLEKNELKRIYSNWDVLYYDESFVECDARHSDGSHKNHERAFIIARKP